MGKFLPLPINAFLDDSHFLVELGISTNENRSFEIKPDLYKIFFIGDEKRDYKGNPFVSIGVYETSTFKEVFYFDMCHLHLYLSPESNHPFRKEKEDEFLYPNFLNEESTKTICTYDIIKCVQEGYSVYINKVIGNHLTTIFEHFNIPKVLIDSFILLSICLANKLWREYYYNPEKPTIDEFRLYKAISGFINNETVKEYPKTIEAIANIKEWNIVKEKVEAYNTQKIIHSPNSRKSRTVMVNRFINDGIKKTLIVTGVNRFIQDDIKRIFKCLVYVFSIKNNIELAISRELAVYILAYFKQIEPFGTKKDFSNFYHSSIYKSMPIDDKPFNQTNYDFHILKDT